MRHHDRRYNLAVLGHRKRLRENRTRRKQMERGKRAGKAAKDLSSKGQRTLAQQLRYELDFPQFDDALPLHQSEITQLESIMSGI